MRKVISLSGLLLCLCLCGCDAGNTQGYDYAEREIFAMDTAMTIKAYGKDAELAVDEAVDEIKRLDTLLSVGINASEVSRINFSGEGTLSEDTQYLVERSLEIFKSTDGAYDITVYPLMKLWGFIDITPALPDESRIREVLSFAGSDKLSLKGNRLVLGEAQGIDLGGIAKGYTGSRIMDIFKKHELISGMVSLGGNVQLYGAKPDGSLWRCGITDPEHPYDGSFIGVVSLRDKAVITSGGYERNFTDTSGKTYHHIMDMKTGYPAESGLLSVTIVSSDGTLADALSTACFVMGADKAAEYWRNSGYEFDMIILTADGKLSVTDGLSDSFESDREYDIINSLPPA